MTLPAFTRKLFRAPARPVPPSRPLPAAIEPLEARIAPASLVSPTTVTFQDKNGDAVTVTISKPLFTAADVLKVFTFDSAFATGSTAGVDSVQQQLELLNIDALGLAAKGINISITAQPVNGSPGIVNVGYINSSGLDLGAVTVAGDLGRIAAGDFAFSAPAIKSLTVDSLGAQGILTQLPGGNLNSLFSGVVGSITVNGDIDSAFIGIGGGVHGVLGALTVTGSINGGAAAFSGAIATQGGVNSVQIGGSINGGAGSSSGTIGTSGHIGAVVVDGSVIGGGGFFSGAILATGSIGSVQIVDNIVGGSGQDSGQVGTASNLGVIDVEGSVVGGGGKLSGVILATHNINTVTINNGLVGGDGASSGQVGAGGSVQTVTIGSLALPGSGISPGIITHPLPLAGAYQGIQDGSGLASGALIVGGSLGSVTIGGDIFGSFTVQDTLRHAIDGSVIGGGGFFGSGDGGGVISARGNIGSVNVTASVIDGAILGNGSIGSVTIARALSDGSEIHAHHNITLVSVNATGSDDDGILFPAVLHPLESVNPSYGEGIVDSAILADTGFIGTILAGGSDFSGGYPIYDASIAAGGNIGAIIAEAIDGPLYAIAYTEVDGGSIGNITASSDVGTAIFSSDFLALKGIGDIAGYGNGSGENGISDGILGSFFRAGAGIAGITGLSYDSVNSGAGGIVSSGFDAGASIGNIDSTGSILGSLFIAGMDLGPGFNITGAGTFNNTSAASFGFGGSHSALAAHIGDITVTEGATESPLIGQSTFLAGVHGPGPDGIFGTKDDSVPAASSIGDIVSPGSLNTVFVESGTIGTTPSSPVDTTLLATAV
jgi:hypothetical protein